MIKTIFIVLFSTAGLGTAAQTTDNKEYNIWNIQKDSSYTVFAKKGYVRSAPSLNSSLIDSIITGEQLTIKEQTDKYETIRNIYAPWVSVVTKNNKQGFVWLGLMAINKIKTGQTNFIYGLERIENEVPQKGDDYVYKKYVLQVKAIQSDSVADTKEWKIDGGESSSYNQVILLGNTRLQNLQDVIRISFGGEACGVPTNYYYYGWTGKKFLALPGKYSVGDADVFYHDETLLFPHEKGGQPGKIIKLIEEESTIEEATETKKARVKHTSGRELYTWDGEKAIKEKKSK